MKGRKCCSRRRECTRTDRRACGALQGIGGTHGPNEVVSMDVVGFVTKSDRLTSSGAVSRCKKGLMDLYCL